MDGRAYCWGSNRYGQLGGGLAAALDAYFGPVPVATQIRWSAVSVGGRHTCARDSQGAAYCWGANGYAQLGDSSTLGPDTCRTAQCSRTPVPVSGGLTFRAIAAGMDHTCGLTDAGAVYCWGYNEGGELGGGQAAPDTGSAVPVRAATDVPFTAISAGERHTCALSAAGESYCWGENRWAQLGPNAPDTCALADGTTLPCSKAPIAVADSLTFVEIAAGGEHTCGRTTDDAVYCWGDNEYGQLGVDPDSTQCDLGVPCTPYPVRASWDTVLTTITAGGAHNCGLAADGAVYCWGDHLIGQLGDCSLRAFSATPQPVCGGHTFIAVSAGSQHTCAVAADGSAYCWGNNDSGELGSSTFTSFGPVQVSAPLWQ